MFAMEELAEQYQAAITKTAAFDLTGWTVLRLRGRDCVNFLHNFCTNDIKSLSIGSGCEAFLTNVKARVVGHVLVFADASAEGTYLTLYASPGQAASLVSHLDRYLITEDVVIHDATSEVSLVYVVGPQTVTALAASGIEPPSETSSPHRFASRYQDAVTVRRADLLGLPGLFLEAPIESSGSHSSAFAAAGVVQAAQEVFESLRIDAAFPLYGTDVSEDHLAPEIGRPWAISYTKGCYLGQEPIARIDALGHVNRELCGLAVEADTVPEPGAPVLADGKEIGAVTSATMSFARNRPIALAYLRAKFSQPGTTVAVHLPHGDVPATVFRAT